MVILYCASPRFPGTSRGSVLNRFFDLREEIKALRHVPELDEAKWMMDLAFLVDITQELNILNMKMRGPY